MRLVIDDFHEGIYNPYYIDVILSDAELDRIRAGEMVNTALEINGKRFYVGALKQGIQDYEEKSREDCESYE